MQLDRANLIHLFKKDDVVCLPFSKNELLEYKHLNHTINTKGQNHKKVLIVVSHSIDDLNSTDNVLLFNILKAIQLTIDDVQLVEFTGIPLKLLLDMKEFDKCILMGINPKQVGLQVEGKPYHTFKLKNKSFLLSHSADLLIKHKKYKEHLWKSLQIMFPLTK